MNRVLIANRGEIAVRIARACADTGRTSIAVYADADVDALHVARADEAYALEGTTSAETYLDIDKLLAVARTANADAVHPGYGFLSESAEFARAVIEAGLIWIGPPPECIESLGDKVSARRIAESVGAPLVAGTPGPVTGAHDAVSFAKEHGLPIAIKAAFGGGGRGLKVAWRQDEIVELYDSAVREAVTAFGRGECFIERYLDKPRHVEVQVLADQHGTVAVLGTRDCSLQRRNQKLVEEAPAPFLGDEQRRRLHTSARDICAAAGYSGAGTVEFLLSADGTISFLEVNTRLQVEHPVTEETTGVDLVAWQFRIAEGERLSFEEATPRGHAIEFRINAEDPGRGFLPTPGRIVDFRPPSGPGVRLDSGVESGSIVPGSFDSLMAKLVVWGESREQALARARRALAEFTIEGVASVLPFHRAVVEDRDFAAETALGVHTRWIETEFSQRTPLAPLTEPHEDSTLVRTWIEIDGRRVRLGVPAGLALRGGDDSAGESPPEASREEPAEGAIRAPLTGTLVRWIVSDGDAVSDGDPVAVMEAMKMETQVTASRAGAIRIVAEPGRFVQSGAELARIET